jgi:hypothetical protein
LREDHPSRHQIDRAVHSRASECDQLHRRLHRECAERRHRRSKQLNGFPCGLAVQVFFSLVGSGTLIFQGNGICCLTTERHIAVPMIGFVRMSVP